MPRVKLFNEEEVLQKAIVLFWEKGYSNTSMQDLVNHLGIHRGSLYDTFGGKKQLFDKAFKTYKKINNARIVEFLGKQKSVKRGLLRLFELPINAAICKNGNRGCFVVNTATEMLPYDKATSSSLKNHKTELEKIFYNHLQRGIETGEISKDKNIESIASFIFALFNGVMVIGKINSDKKYLLNIIKTGLLVLD